MLSAVALNQSYISLPSVKPLGDSNFASNGRAEAEAPKQSENPSAPSSGYNTAPLSKDAVTALQEADASGKSENQLGLSEEQAAQVKQLKERDREVRAHEQAHAQVGGQYAGSPTYEYQTGPDNQRYAVGGEVKIDTSEIPGDPEATITKMDIVIRAALAPAEPSAQDRKVAAMASAKKSEALVELNQQTQAERNGEATDSDTVSPSSDVTGGVTGGTPTPPIIDLIA
ncbi:MAG: hypothetical protein JJ879_07750 [Sneathiella sp.]|nr:hypothetical protein [Sneathiella sp.]